MEKIRLTRFLDGLTPFLQSISGDILLYEDFYGQ